MTRWRSLERSIPPAFVREFKDLDFVAPKGAAKATTQFFRDAGYEPFGAVFEEAGMPHLEMKKKLQEISK